MRTRTVVTVAGAITLTVLASTSALAVNFRGADDRPPGDVGTFSPAVDVTQVPPQIVTVYVDVPTGAATTPVAVSAAPEPVAVTQAGSVVPAGVEHERETSEHQGGEDDD